jgi:hypothetical protein
VRLQSKASQGRSRLSKEQLDQDRLQQLTIEVDALSNLELGQELQARHAHAASSLGAISPTSFSYAKAKELQNRLDGIWDAANKQNSDAHAPSREGGGSSANQRPARPPSSGAEAAGAVVAVADSELAVTAELVASNIVSCSRTFYADNKHHHTQ